MTVTIRWQALSVSLPASPPLAPPSFPGLRTGNRGRSGLQGAGAIPAAAAGWCWVKGRSLGGVGGLPWGLQAGSLLSTGWPRPQVLRSMRPGAWAGPLLQPTLSWSVSDTPPCATAPARAHYLPGSKGLAMGPGLPAQA